MNQGLVAYHDLVDTLVARKDCVLAQRVLDGSAWPASSKLSQFNSLLAGLDPMQREQIAALLTMSREGGIHDALVVLSERMNLRGLRLVEGENQLPHEPHGTEIYFDWVARCSGEAWPHEG